MWLFICVIFLTKAWVTLGCGGTLDVSLTPRTLVSPGYPNNYGNDLSCQWILQSTSGSLVWVSITDIDIELSTTCNYDSLRIYDGLTTSGTLLGTHCGTAEPSEPLISTRNSATVLLTTDKSVVRRGFSLQYKQVCANFRFGAQCTSVCGCSQGNTESCNSLDGSCVCNEGWEGTNCTEDINECQLNTDNCPQDCVNNDGGFQCVCRSGFYGDGMTCSPCQAFYYGLNCSTVCDCQQSNSIGCNAVSGECNCSPGWTGDDCTEDVNECLQSPYVCAHICSNTAGSYTCSCRAGHRSSGSACIACAAFTYGTECSSECTCDRAHTSSCDAVRGTCTCAVGWTGSNCDADIDECSLTTDNCQQTCTNTLGSFTCSCRSGFVGNGVTCEACAAFTYGIECSSECTCDRAHTTACDAVRGTCTCAVGWTGSNCDADIDECSLTTDNCQQTCTNTPGSFTCSCRSGFFGNGVTCEACLAFTYGTECSSECTCVRAHTTSCDDVRGICTCAVGWTGSNCDVDIDECTLNTDNCQQTCTNTPGSFSCSCRSGFFGNGVTCEECTCHQSNSIGCNAISGECNCRTGWTGDDCTEDVNECLQSPSVCAHICSNTVGSYACSCRPGHRSSGATCIPCAAFNFGTECSSDCTCDRSHTTSCDAVSGTCTCSVGWTGSNCDSDIDECSLDTDNCQQTCTNAPGSFTCSCQSWFFGTGISCEACTCQQSNSIGCNAVSGECNCRPGWTGDDCTEDVNECMQSPSVCAHICSNTAGSYACSCRVGHRSSGSSCIACAAFTYGIECSSECTCDRAHTTSCDAVRGTCTCAVGWTGSNCDADIDECSLNTDTCQQTCSNTPGSYSCSCRSGYSGNGVSCTDVNECLQSPSVCSQICSNTVGSYECSCRTGHRRSGTTCINVNECLQSPSVCSQICSNTVGSYECSCRTGHRRSGTTCIKCAAFTFGTECSSECTCDRAHTTSCDAVRGTCTCAVGWTGSNCDADIDECRLDTDNCMQICTNTPGSFTCSCRSGYSHNGVTCDACAAFTYGSECSSDCTCDRSHTTSCDAVAGTCTCSVGWTGRNCDADIDECRLNRDNCQQTCTNTPGSFSCSCRSGYSSNGVTCRACTAFTYGTECSSECTCDRAHTTSCDAVRGTCTCAVGWTGTNCDVDINECLLNTDNCQQTCTNTPGSFSCSCRSGYYGNGVTCIRVAGFPFTYGSSAGDRCYSGQDDTCFQQRLRINIPIGYQMSNIVYVSPNGLMCVRRPVRTWIPPTRYRTYDYRFYNSHCIAPYFNDMDTRWRGRVCVKVYEFTSSNAYHYSSTFNYIRQHIRSSIRTSYNPAIIIKITWDSLPRFPSRDTKTATFQFVYVTDGSSVHSFVFYKQGGMQYRTSNIFIGVINGGFLTTIPASYQAILRPDQHFYLNGVRGALYFPVPSSFTYRTNYEILCYRWAYRERYYISRYWWYMRWMPRCPCNYFFVRFDRRFRVFDSSRTHIYVALRWWRFSQICVYSRRRWNIILSGSTAGTFVRYYPSYWYRRYDVRYRSYCCRYSNLCSVYYSVRPYIRSCSWRFWWRFGWFFGDPHITSLDQKTYTFNGHAEYHLLNIPSINFQLQCRMDRLTRSDGSLSDATVFSAFAVKGNNTFAQIQLNYNKTGMDIFAGGDNFTNDYTNSYYENETFTEDLDNGLSLIRDNNTLTLSFLNGISFNVTTGNKLLTMSLGVLTDFANLTEGLLGNFNGDPDDDMIPRGLSDPISATSTERENFAFGQTWQTTPDESIFMYSDGESWHTYNFSDFTPKFLDEANQTLVAEANRTCSGDVLCTYDLVFTGNRELALQTRNTDEVAENVVGVTENESPRIGIQSGTTLIEDEHYIYVVQGEVSTFSVNATDDGNVTFSVDNPTSAVLTSHQDGVGADINITVQTAHPEAISIIVSDEHGLSMTTEVVIVFCSGCFNHGNCSFSELREDNRTTDYFKYARCECEIYWEGDDCQLDANGCEFDPCSFNRTCTDVPAETHRNNPSMAAFECSPCPDGYVDDDEDPTKCDDIDECNSTIIPCSHTCDNNIGSYTCACYTGYRLTRDSHTCIDNNECDEGTSRCVQRCENTPGGYICSCFDGYIYNETTYTCTGSPPIICENANCSNAHGCTNNNGSLQCFCELGYHIDSQNTCTDINECEQNMCSQVCNNTIGSFQCSCYAGFFLLEDRLSCEECTPPSYGESCQQSCHFGHGVVDCDPVRGALCSPGYEQPNCTDIDECAVNEGICGNTNKICNNTVGSYICTCRDGYIEDADGTCKDNDECSDLDLNTCHHICSNSIGGFSCACNAGFLQDTTDSSACIDIDECATETSMCDQRCVNSPGSYRCECYSGFVLMEDRRSCLQVKDVCNRFPGVHCSQICRILENQPVCDCNIGYTLGIDNKTCLDINECSSEVSHRCSDPDSCTNSDGGYICACRPGFKLDNDQRTCTACDPYHYGVNCAQECACGVGALRCDPISGCVCDDNWSGDKCDQDRDECSLTASPCSGHNKECINTPGSYRCQCEQGYSEGNNEICVDIDECADTTLHDCDQVCVNALGNYTCTCFNGFQRHDNRCIDINECEGSNHNCTQVCNNMIGGYRCSCIDGYRLDQSDRRNCRPLSECIDNICNSDADCTRINETETCTCRIGYQFENGSTTTCVDIPECTLVPSPCSQLCIEDQGRYRCVCDSPGYFLDDDGSTCTSCSDNKYGNNCTNTCSCISANSLLCNPVNGECTCKTGWMGNMCQTDIDECQTTTCPENAACHNSNGSFTCSCRNGYLKTGNGICQECDNYHFGQDCDQECDCDHSNAVRCHSVTGECTCRDGWTGSTCINDIDECASYDNICNDDHKRCVNSAGSYTCSCNTGFVINNLDQCIDIDECLLGTNDCFHSCTNTQGSYTCLCRPGYTGDGHTCTPCPNNTWGFQCENDCECEAAHIIECDPVTGCHCITGWRGNTCADDVNECENGNNMCQQNSECYNTKGSYECVCDAHFVHINSTACEIGVFLVRMELVIDIQVPQTVDFNVDATNTEYRSALEIMIENVLRVFMGTNLDRVSVTSLRRGSLLASVNVIMKDSIKAKQSFTIAVLALAKNWVVEMKQETGNVQSLMLEESSVNFTTMNDDDLKCQIYRLINGTCDSDMECIVKDGMPTCRTKEVKSNMVMLAIGIGSAMGGVILIFVIAICIARYVKTKGSASKKLKSNKEESKFRNAVPLRMDTQGPGYPYTEQSQYFDDISESLGEKRYRLGATHDEKSFEIQTSIGSNASQRSWYFSHENILPSQQYKIPRPSVESTS